MKITQMSRPEKETTATRPEAKQDVAGIRLVSVGADELYYIVGGKHWSINRNGELRIKENSKHTFVCSWARTGEVSSILYDDLEGVSLQLKRVIVNPIVRAWIEKKNPPVKEGYEESLD